MKRLLCALLCLAVCLFAGTAAADMRFHDFFRSMEGHISFTLPSMPYLLKTQDYPEETARLSGIQYIGWLNKSHLLCSTVDGEWVTYVADLTPMINQMVEDHPGWNLTDYQANALVNLATLELGLYDGYFVAEPAPVIRTAGGEGEEEEYVEVYFIFGYPDDQNAYIGKGIMDGAQAVLSMGVYGDEANALIDQMTYIPTSQLPKAPEAETIRVGRAQITFPGAVARDETEEYAQYDGMGPGYSYLRIDNLPLNGDDALDPDDVTLAIAAESVGDSYLEHERITEYSIRKVKDGLWLCEGPAPIPSYVDASGYTRRLYSFYIAPDNIYILYYPDNEAGRAFLDSLNFGE